MHIGQKFKIVRRIADMNSSDAGKYNKNSRIDWATATVAYIPTHKRFVSFRFHFRNIFGQKVSYRESYLMQDIEPMLRKGLIREV